MGCSLNEVGAQLGTEQRRFGDHSVSDIHAGVVEEGPAFHHLSVACPVSLRVLVRLDPTRWASLPRAPVGPREMAVPQPHGDLSLDEG